MIGEEKIRLLVEQHIGGTSSFLVDLKVGADNSIQVQIDDDEGFSISDCVKLSRYLEEKLDRDSEDFALSVSSPGLTEPLKVSRQYVKNIGREVKVKLNDDTSVEGLMDKVDEAGIEVAWRTKERIEGRKAKEWVDHRRAIPFSEIKETKIKISFK